MKMKIKWITCQNGEWAGLDQLELCGSCIEGDQGVYVIWHCGEAPSILRVGRGPICERLQAERQDPAVRAYASRRLCATWAEVEEPYRDGVTAWLVGRLQPQVPGECPECEPIEVNLPWN